jgi:hypothetical protein
MSAGTAARIVPTTVTRIADLDSQASSVVPIGRERWGTGDYVVARVREMSRALRQVELPNGRMADIARGELVMGALGRRAATLEAVGDWRDVTDDGVMHLLTSAGLMGRATSVSPFLPPLVALEYVGHLHLHGELSRMTDWVVPAPHGARFDLPVVLVIGTSMSAGKTESAKVAVAQLRDLGLGVVGAKLTGAARYRDPLAMWDAGATAVLDFVDAGLPSTAVPTDDYVRAMGTLLARMGSVGADVAVIEAGASPMEEYNGAALAEIIGPHVCFTLLCASDPYAVAGLMDAFGTKPDLVAGGAANTTAGAALVERLTGLTALNLADPGTHAELRRRLDSSLPASAHASAATEFGRTVAVGDDGIEKGCP